MTALGPVSGRLQRLVLMLSSSSDGEALAAARAIGRLLTSVGADWHTLASALLPPDRPAADRRTEAWRADLEFCVGRIQRLKGRDRDFVVDMLAWTQSRAPTLKQSAWLKDIVRRAA